MSNSAINIFIIEVTLIDPINDILSKFKNNEFRDCDIKWLNDRLKKFTDIALKTLGKDFNLSAVGETNMNGFIKDQFVNHFNVLLNYFKTFN